MNKNPNMRRQENPSDVIEDNHRFDTKLEETNELDKTNRYNLENHQLALMPASTNLNVTKLVNKKLESRWLESGSVVEIQHRPL